MNAVILTPVRLFGNGLAACLDTRPNINTLAVIDGLDTLRETLLAHEVHVVLVDVTDGSYPDNEHARRLLHVAMTRSAHQLWVTYTGRPSPLLPEHLR